MYSYSCIIQIQSLDIKYPNFCHSADYVKWAAVLTPALNDKYFKVPQYHSKFSELTVFTWHLYVHTVNLVAC